MGRTTSCSACISGKGCLTGLCGSLDCLTDCESDSGRLTHTPTQTPGCKISPDGDIRNNRSHGKLQSKAERRKQFKARVERLADARCAWVYHQTRHWALSDARKCSTSYKGRSDQVTDSRPAIPAGATGVQIIQILRDNDYDLLHVK
jgi:hypothetical protein